ncbi:serine hydrolase domain-containing protein [Vallitalea sediminicola]
MKKIIKLLMVFGVFICVLLSPQVALAQTNNGQVDSLTRDEKATIEKFIKENMDKGEIPGLSITIVRGDKTIYQKGFGYSNIESKTPVTEKTLFELGSTSKAFTGLAILKLEQDGLINLDDNVSRYINWFKTNYSGQSVNITLEQLLHHSSGIPFKTIDKIPVGDKDNTLEQTVKTLVDIELDSKPGEKFQYATINYDVLGLIIEKVSGVSYEKYMEENIIKPSGLNNTYLFKNQDNINHMSTGYKLRFLKPREYDAPVYRGNKPAGYIISSGEDMARWLKIQMGTSTETVFDNTLVEQSHIPNRTIPPTYYGASYAAGWDVYQELGGRISHTGSNPNYSSYITFKPEKKEGIAALSNINSDYVGFICRGISSILNGKEYNKANIKDLNKKADSISIFIIGFVGLIIVVTLYFIGKLIKEIITKHRKFTGISVRKSLDGFICLIIIMGVMYCIYLVPYILGNGISWNFVFVWLPSSIKIAVYLICISICIAYIYVILTSLLKKKMRNQY